MRTLYISDLDGTLLTSDAALSDYTAQALQQLIGEGLLFSAATARTLESSRRILDAILPLPVPIVLQNGAQVYDTLEQRYIKKEIIPPEVVLKLVACLRAHNLSGFLYSLKEARTEVYHEDITRSYMQRFAALRKTIYGKRFTYTDELADHADESIVYFSIQDERENLEGLHASLRGIDGIGCTFYPDSYMKGCWFLECYAHTASKYNAVRWLRETYGFDKIVGFGDNLNDIPLFEACDESYAVANAREELKAIATGVIGSNDEDGVAQFLLNEKCE